MSNKQYVRFSTVSFHQDERADLTQTSAPAAQNIHTGRISEVDAQKSKNK